VSLKHRTVGWAADDQVTSPARAHPVQRPIPFKRLWIAMAARLAPAKSPWAGLGVFNLDRGQTGSRLAGCGSSAGSV
jgi:hypothetical protein